MAAQPCRRGGSVPGPWSTTDPEVEVEWWRWTDDGSVVGARHAGAVHVELHAGRRGVEHFPADGYAMAHDVQRWARHVTVYVSPTGRSVRVWVDGVEVPRPADTGGGDSQA